MKREPAKRTVVMEDGVWYRLGNKGYHQCCNPDCLAIHSVSYKLELGVLWERWTLLKRETAKAQAKHKGRRC